MYIYIFTCIFTCTYVFIYIYIYTHVFCIYTRMEMCVQRAPTNLKRFLNYKRWSAHLYKRSPAHIYFVEAVVRSTRDGASSTSGVRPAHLQAVFRSPLCCIEAVLRSTRNGALTTSGGPLIYKRCSTQHETVPHLQTVAREKVP